MADILLVLGLLAVAVVGTLVSWRRLRGASGSKIRLAGRVAVALLLGVLVVGGGTYHLTKSRSFQLAGELVQRVDTDERVIALTFDDGPEPGYTDWVLGELRARGVSATFYLTGAACEENPELVRAIVADGHELGNHSYSHRRLYFLSSGAVADEVERTDALFRAAGYEGPITFRMPGCKRLLTTPLYLAANDRTTVTWDLEPDSMQGLAEDPGLLADHVVDEARPGSIVLLHVMYEARQATRDALPHILERLSKQGYRFATVSELLALR